MNVSDVLVKSLEIEGVKYIFGLPGEENEDLLFSLKNSSITFIPTRHEQGAAFMADVWGRITGKAGVCLATLGPGATNLVTGLADAYMDKSPVVAITGQGGSERLHKESHQYIDVVNMMRPISKWTVSIQNPAIVPEAVRKAFKLAQMEKPGVTHLELPEDIAKLPLSSPPMVPKIVRRPSPDYKAINQALELLKHAKRPIILAGNGAIRKRSSKHLRAFVESTNIPVVATFMGKGAISDRSKQSLHTIGVRGMDFPVCAIDASDLILSIGYDLAEYNPKAWNTRSDRPIIHIDFIPAEVDSYYQPEVEIVGDISAALWELNQKINQLSNVPFSNWYMSVRQAIEDDQLKYANKSTKSITIPWVLSELRSKMEDEDIILSDVGSHKMWIGRNFPVYEPGTCIISNGLASMGIALPGGIAAKLAQPDRRVVAVNGDGGFLMNVQEIETAKRLGLAFTILILNDNNYGLIKWKQEAHRKDSFGTNLTNPDFLTLGKSFGIKARYPKSKKDVSQAIADALSSDELNLLAIDIDPSENLRLSEMLDKNLCSNFQLQVK